MSFVSQIEGFRSETPVFLSDPNHSVGNLPGMILAEGEARHLPVDQSRLQFREINPAPEGQGQDLAHMIPAQPVQAPAAQAMPPVQQIQVANVGATAQAEMSCCECIALCCKGLWKGCFAFFCNR